MNNDYDQYLKDLYQVGISKAVGYLPLSTIMRSSKSVDQLIQFTSDKKLSYRLFQFGEGHTFSGALYFWDDKMLQELLEKYKDILSVANVPTLSVDYINHIEKVLVPSNKYPKAHIVIGLTFNDSRFVDSTELEHIM